ncbi:hypothetical protein FRC12_018086 [Ceratobasidium sp. 428]|nr:hypothetical protein FRC12_018086 [Ceratobasidium sp. 428]
MPGSPSLRMISLFPPSSIRLPDGKVNYGVDGRVITGNLVGLVNRLLTTRTSRQDEEFRDCFLAVYREFTSTTDLLHLLVEQYETRLFECVSERERVRLHMNMVNILANWLDVQALTIEDSEFLHEMETFTNTSLANNSPTAEYTNLQAKIKGQVITLLEYLSS